ncbi:uncharacterized protein LOC130700721 [Daphnia carinata]|uniref:uncharacterized protein LOC130700721 n=1 Tax=Daphnia carinata TaxID=120202 RepID=UPI0028692F8E|nr:uncharacterized protein LOC130700721 [Daphnia carinata]
MATPKFGPVSLLMIVAASYLMVSAAEEELPASTARQSKQILLVPSMTPANTFPLGLYARAPLPYQFLMPQQDPLLRTDLIDEEPKAFGWPYNMPSVSSDDDEQVPSWRGYDSVADHGGLKWWKKRFNRQALISLTPSALECLTTNIATDGLGPCKRASQANHGTIEIKFPEPEQTAVIGITANSPVNTRVMLLCTVLTDMAVFTQTGKIGAVSDTPRTEMGYMQIIATSTAANAVLKCHWTSYRHYTATYP